MMKAAYWPLYIMLILIILFTYGLSQDPHGCPSNLVTHPAPTFNAPDLFKINKKVNSRTELFGHYTLVNIWASWCEPCRMELPFLLQIKKCYTKIHQLGINYRDDPLMAQSMLIALGNPYDRIVLDEKGQMGLDWGISGTPETFLVDPKGAILYHYAGILNEQIWKKKFLKQININIESHEH